MSNSQFVVDFIARGEAPDEWLMVLVENGPWTEPIEVELSRLQNRLYDCMDAAIDGQLASKFPESNGKRITIRIDGYMLPVPEIQSFFKRFTEGVIWQGGYAADIEKSPFVASIEFLLKLNSDLN